MPRLGPIRRQDLIRYLRLLAFEGPYSGGRHQFMARQDIRSGYLTPIEVISGESSLQEYYAKPISAGMSGRSCDGFRRAKPCLVQPWGPLAWPS